MDFSRPYGTAMECRPSPATEVAGYFQAALRAGGVLCKGSEF
jgi:hypothetical protein